MYLLLYHGHVVSKEFIIISISYVNSENTLLHHSIRTGPIQKIIISTQRIIQVKVHGQECFQAHTIKRIFLKLS